MQYSYKSESGLMHANNYGEDQTASELKNRIKILEKELAVHQKKEEEMERLAIAVRDSNDAVTLQDMDGRITAWNHAAERMYGYTEAEALQMSMYNIVPPGRLRTTQYIWERIKEGDIIDSFETQRMTRVGKLLDIWLTVTPVYDNRGTMRAIATTERDITDHKRFEKALKKDSQAIKLFVYSVMHDLKSPVVAINGLVQRISKKFNELSKDQIENYCFQIIRTSETILEFVEMVNDYFSEKGGGLAIEKVSMAELMGIISDEFAPQLDNQEVKLIEREKLPQIHADRISLLRLLRNLVDNALKYGGDKLSEIKISHRETSQYHIFSVGDNGVGFSKEEAEDIFRPFKRQDSSLGTYGAGLGLAIVKEIAELHNGEVWTEHEKLNGATFCFSVSKTLWPLKQELSATI